MSSESLWIAASVIIIVTCVLVVLALLLTAGPKGIFDLFYTIMGSIGLYVISQLHAILR